MTQLSLDKRKDSGEVFLQEDQERINKTLGQKSSHTLKKLLEINLSAVIFPWRFFFVTVRSRNF